MKTRATGTGAELAANSLWAELGCTMAACYFGRDTLNETGHVIKATRDTFLWWDLDLMMRAGSFGEGRRDEEMFESSLSVCFLSVAAPCMEEGEVRMAPRWKKTESPPLLSTSNATSPSTPLALTNQAVLRYCSLNDKFPNKRRWPDTIPELQSFWIWETGGEIWIRVWIILTPCRRQELLSCELEQEVLGAES